MKLSRDALTFYLSRIIIAALALGAHVYFVRVLGAAGIGVFYLFLSLFRISYQSTSEGIGIGIAKLTAEKGESYLVSGALLMLPVLTVFTAIAFLLQSHINSYVGIGTAAYYLVTAIWASAFSESLFSQVRGEEKVGNAGLIDSAGKAVEVGVQIALVFVGWQVNGLFTGFVLGYIARVVFFNWQRDFGFQRPSLERVKTILEFSRSSYLDNIISGRPMWVDLLIIGFLLEQFDAGIYGTVWRIVFVAVMFADSIGEALLPEVSKSGKEVSREVTRQAIAFAPLLAIPTFFGSLVIGPEMLVLLFGGDFAGTGYLLPVVALAGVFLSVHKNMMSAIYGRGRPDRTLRIHFAGLVLNVALNIVLIQYIGLIGAAIGSLAATVLVTSLAGRFLRDGESFFPWRKWSYQLSAGLLMATGVFGLERLVSLSTVTELSGLIFSGVMIYFGLLWFIDTEFRSRLGEVSGIL